MSLPAPPDVNVREDRARHGNLHAPAAALGYVGAVVIMLVALPVEALLLLVTWPFDRNRTVPGRFLRLMAVALSACFLTWRLRLEGRWPGKGPYVVVANHQSLLDILLISRVPREMKWMAKESLFKVPWMGWMFVLSGDIPVRRGDAESGSAALRKAKEYLARGMSVMIFPEGTRSRTGALGSFKSGAFRLAIEAGVPVLPIVVSGTAAGYPKGSPWVRPCRGTARILEPVASAGFKLEDASKLKDAVRERIAAALPP
ncbi:MAG TPA: lysophospholipid acyltransferase family protein [Anaeromyxobacter sp.]|nr:lysophospholipid acyltransferase family protein [Anaeromyxobacter sp.]